jgi:hypothetical protein
MPNDRDLADRLRRWGLNVVEVDGWQDRGTGRDFRPGGQTSHHTAGGPRGVAPSLRLVIEGGSNTAPGPLANVLQGRADDGTDPIFVVAAGTANHAGSGGWNGLSQNSSVWGNEIEHTGIETLPEHRVEIACRVAAACVDGTAGAEMTMQHHEWSNAGKIDVARDPTDSGPVDGDVWRLRVAQLLAAGPNPVPVPVPPAPIVIPELEAPEMFRTYQEAGSGDECALAINGDRLYFRRAVGGAWTAWAQIKYPNGTDVVVDPLGGISRTVTAAGVPFPYFLVLGKPTTAGVPTMVKVDLAQAPFGIPLAVAV